ncbi:MAG: BrnT family toxin [Candidatus Hydrogenedentes bacterium]|nr:BrnT family toxin [Candidatus Hydrogenedentota bacterium]
MSELRFTWDPKKAHANRQKHGISFEEAQSVFYDENAIEFYDDEHSEWEDRFLLLGISSRLRLLMICHCYRESEGIIRIVSARKATQRESAHYRRT